MKTRKEVLGYIQECEKRIKALYNQRTRKEVRYADIKRIDNQIISLENRLTAYKHVLL